MLKTPPRIFLPYLNMAPLCNLEIIVTYLLLTCSIGPSWGCFFPPSLPNFGLGLYMVSLHVTYWASGRFCGRVDLMIYDDLGHMETLPCSYFEVWMSIYFFLLPFIWWFTESMECSSKDDYDKRIITISMSGIYFISRGLTQVSKDYYYFFFNCFFPEIFSFSTLH